MTVVTLRGKALQIIGALPSVGTTTPDFTLTNTALEEVSLSEFLEKNKNIVLNIFPSIDTPTCSQAMRHFHQLAEQEEKLLILCISADLPFAQKRFCGAENITKVIPLSTFRHPEFGQHYGVTVMNGPLAGLLSRAVVMINDKAKVIYTQQVPEISEEPDYQRIIDVWKNNESSIKG